MVNENADGKATGPEFPGIPGKPMIKFPQGIPDNFEDFYTF